MNGAPSGGEVTRRSHTPPSRSVTRIGGSASSQHWQVWAKKIIEEARERASDKPATPIKSFLRDFFLRQYGVRSVAVKAVGDFLYSLRVMLGMETDERAVQLAERGHENRARLELFAGMCGLGEDGSEQWPSRKLSFFLVFLSNVIGRERDPGGANAAKIAAAKLTGGPDPSSSKEHAQGLKEKLTKKRLLLKLSTVTLELPKLVNGLQERQSL